jgi:hypothetical protein
MRGWLEALICGQFLHHLGDGPLKGRRRGYVDDSAAARAQKMMMVLGQVLGQLEPGELVTGSNTSH